MKKLCLISAIAVFLLFCVNGVQAQITETKLNQVELMKQFVGIWQMTVSEDTIQIFEVQQYEKAFISISYLLINDTKVFSSALNLGYSSKDNRFRGFTLWSSGGYMTSISSFTSENKWVGDWVRNFNPEAVTEKFEIVFDTLSSMTISEFTPDGIMTKENRFNKIN
jgi:hypothetical protein